MQMGGRREHVMDVDRELDGLIAYYKAGVWALNMLDVLMRSSI